MPDRSGAYSNQQALEDPNVVPSLREHGCNQHLLAPQLGTLLTAGAQHDVQGISMQSTNEQLEHDHGESRRLPSPDAIDIRQNETIQRKLTKVSRWLAAVDHTQKHKETHNLRQPGTCMWFPRTATYDIWRTGKTAFLWLNGQSGCGKSVLVASTIEHLKTTLESGEVLVYFYCDFQNERSTRATEVLRSLLSQLFRHFSDSDVDPGTLLDLILEQARDGTLALDDLDLLARWVMRTTFRFPRKPIIVIDALDECVDTNELLRAFSMWTQADVRLLVTSRPLDTINHHFQKRPSLSLHEMAEKLAADIGLYITQELFSHRQLRTATAKLKNEIRRKLHKQAEGRFRWVKCQLDTLRNCSTSQELLKALGDLPEGLAETYERILGKIDERRSEGQVARRALAWLAVALVPLRLAQLVEGLSIDHHQRIINRGEQSLGPALLSALSSLVEYNDQTDVLALSHYSVKEYLTSRAALPMYHIVLNDAHAEVTEMCMFYVTVVLKHVPFHANRALLETFPLLSYVFTTGFHHLAYVNLGSTIILDVIERFAWQVQHHPSHWDLLCELREDDSRRPYPPWPSSRHDLVLYILVAYSSVGLLKLFLSRVRPVKTRVGTNPLVYATDLWRTEQAMDLLESDVDPHTPGLVVDDCRHATPLEIAIDLGNDELVGELLRRRSMVTWELLATAVYNPWCSTRVLVQLVQTDEFVQWAHAFGADEGLYHGIFNVARPNAGDINQTDRDHVVLARRLREIGLSLDPRDSFCRRLIGRALHAGHTSMLEYLLPPDQPPPSRLLIVACTANIPETTRVSVVRFLIGKGVSVRALSGRRRDTALHLAAMSRWEPYALELTEILLDAGGDPGARNSRGWTPLVIAMRRGHRTLVERLLLHSVPIPSYILLLALERREKPWMIQLLIRNGANVNARSSDGATVLHLAVRYAEDVIYEWDDEEHTTVQVEHQLQKDHLGIVPNDAGALDDDAYWNGDGDEDWYMDEDDMYDLGTEYEEAERLQLVRIFIGGGCDPTSRDGHGRTVLEAACINGYVSMVEHLLSCNVPFPDSILLTVLEDNSSPDLEMIEILLSKDADVHATTSGGDTVLHLSVSMFDDESTCLTLVKLFIEAGCNSTSRGGNGRTVLETAVKKGYTSVVEYLLSSKVPLPPDILPAMLSHGITPEMAGFLLSKGADVHCTAPSGDTVLHLSVFKYDRSTCLKLIKLFIEAGCDLTSRGTRGKTVLEVASILGYTSVVEYLVLSCNISLPPDILLMVLSRGLTPQMAKFLLSKDVDMLYLSNYRYSESTCLRLVKLFTEAGCDSTSHSGMAVKMALEIVSIHGYTSVVEYLLSCNVSLPPDILPTVLLHASVSTPKMVEFLLSKGADVHATTSEGDTVLYLSIFSYDESTSLELVKLLFIEASCDPFSHSAMVGGTVLEVASICGYTSVVEYLLSCNVPLPPDILPTVLSHGLTKMVKFLLNKGADVHATTPEGDTVLHMSLYDLDDECDESTCLELVKLFTAAGCDPTLCSAADGKTVLEVASIHGYTSVVEYLLSCNVPLPPDILPTVLSHGSTPQIVGLLLGRGANVHATTSEGDTVLCLSFFGYDESTCLELVKLFVKASCDPTSHCDHDTVMISETVLEVASIHGYTSLVEYLLSCNVPLPPDILTTVLSHGLTKMAKFLLNKGADVRATTSEGDTVLHMSLYDECDESTCLELIELFIRAGCDPTSGDAMGRTALEVACEKGYTSVVEYLLPYNVPLPPDLLLTALQLGLIPQMIALLVRGGANVHTITPSGDTALHLAISRYTESDCLALCEIFIDTGCIPACHNSEATTIWNIAMERGYTSVVKLLLWSHVPRPPDILLMALWYRLTPQMISLLLRVGADVHLTTAKGDTALHLVVAGYCERFCLDLVEWVIEAGCNPNCHNSEGKSVLVTAIGKGYIRVVELLLRYNVPLPPEILLFTLHIRSTPQMVELLVRSSADILNKVALIQATHYAYTAPDRQQILEILENSWSAKRAHVNLEDELHTPVAKRPRLEPIATPGHTLT